MRSGFAMHRVNFLRGYHVASKPCKHNCLPACADKTKMCPQLPVQQISRPDKTSLVTLNHSLLLIEASAAALDRGMSSRACMCAAMQSKHELTREQDGPTYDVFTRVLRGLSNSKLVKPGKFRTADTLGYALRCSYKVLALLTCCL